MFWGFLLIIVQCFIISRGLCSGTLRSCSGRLGGWHCGSVPCVLVWDLPGAAGDPWVGLGLGLQWRRALLLRDWRNGSTPCTRSSSAVQRWSRPGSEGDQFTNRELLGRDGSVRGQSGGGRWWGAWRCKINTCRKLPLQGPFSGLFLRRLCLSSHFLLAKAFLPHDLFEGLHLDIVSVGSTGLERHKKIPVTYNEQSKKQPQPILQYLISKPYLRSSRMGFQWLFWHLRTLHCCDTACWVQHKIHVWKSKTCKDED